jgi:hypothetical protein
MDRNRTETITTGTFTYRRVNGCFKEPTHLKARSIISENYSFFSCFIRIPVEDSCSFSFSGYWSINGEIHSSTATHDSREKSFVNLAQSVHPGLDGIIFYQETIISTCALKTIDILFCNRPSQFILV